MSELTFTKSFLTTLDSKPQKYPSTHIFPAGSFTPRTPYTLPKLPHPPYPLPPQGAALPPPAPGSTASDVISTVTLKSSRHPKLEIVIKDVNARETRVSQLKESVRKELVEQGYEGVDLSKVKILWNKKPIPSSKETLGDVLEEASIKKEGVELGVMILGGVNQTGTPTAGTPSTAAAATGGDPMEGLEKAASPSQPVAQGPAGKEVLETEEFWDDLKGFLEQRLKDEGEATRLTGLFRAISTKK